MTDKKSYIEEINKLSIYITEQYTNVTVDTVRFGQRVGLIIGGLPVMLELEPR